jgi:type I restriction enzyme, S subunit
MVSDWNEDILSNIAEVIDSRHKTPVYSDSGYPMIRVVDVNGGALNLENTKRVSDEVYEDFSRGRDPEVGDLVISRVGSYGVVSYVNSDEKFCLGQNTAFIIPKINSRFLYYQLISPFVKWQIEQFVVGAVQKTISLKSIRQFQIKLPPEPEQKAIAHILGSLDDKIELNRQMNETLEALAQALFKSWFVDFDPVIDNALAAGNAIPDEFFERAEQRKGIEKKDNSDIQDLFPDEFEFTEEMGWIPKGWGVKSLDEVADYLNGLALQKYRPEDIDDNYLPIVKIAQLREGLPNHDEKASINIKPEYIIDNGDVIFSWSGSLLVDVWCGGKAALNQHLFKVTSDKYPKWFYLNYTKHHLVEFQRIATDKAVTMGHIKRGHLKEALCVIPENGVDDNIFAVFEGILNKQIRLRIESQTLAKLRDTLLPKLMSGELRIPDAAELVGEAII